MSFALVQDLSRTKVTEPLTASSKKQSAKKPAITSSCLKDASNGNKQELKQNKLPSIKEVAQ